MNDQIISRHIAHGTVGAESRERRIDESRIDGAQFFFAEFKPFHGSRAKILDQHVGAGGEPLQEFDAFGRFEIDRDAFLVSVDAEEVRALASGERGTPAAGGVADSRLFHFHHLGAEIAEKHRAIGTGQHASQIENPNASEGA